MINPNQIFAPCDDNCVPDEPCAVCTLREEARFLLVEQQAAIDTMLQQIEDFRPYSNAEVGGEAFWVEMNRP